MPSGRNPLIAPVLLICVVAVLCPATGAGADPASDPPQLLFERAEALYRQLDAVNPAGDSAAWGQVADVFHLVVERYPDSELASEALWRVAQIRSRQGESGSEEAVDAERHAYEDLLGRYPDSPYAPETMLRLAILEEQHPEPDSSPARLYQKLIQQHPGTPQAELARRRLASLPSDRRAAAPDGSADSSASADPAERRSLGQPAGPKAGGEVASSAVPAQQVRHSDAGDDDSPEPPTDASTPAPSDAPPSAETESELARVVDIRHYADTSHTRVVVELDRAVRHAAGETSEPPRVFFDLMGAELPDGIEGERVDGELLVPGSGKVGESNVEAVRVAQNRPDVVRVVIDLAAATRYSLFTLENAFRVVVDVPAKGVANRLAEARRPATPSGEESVARQLRLGVHRIVIDPGHGGDDPGAIGRSGATEKDLALDLARRLAEMFRDNQGYEVVLTRDSDRSLPLDERTRIANESGADLFVSLHINSSHNRRLSGFETYFLNLATDPSAAEVAARENAVARARLANLEDLLDRIVKNEHRIESRDLARSIQDSLVSHVSNRWDGVRDLGVKQAPFFVLVGSEMPAVLVEASFLSHSEEEQRLREAAYRQQLAEALYIGIEGYVESRQVAVYPAGYEPD